MCEVRDTYYNYYKLEVEMACFPFYLSDYEEKIEKKIKFYSRSGSYAMDD